MSDAPPTLSAAAREFVPPRPLPEAAAHAAGAPAPPGGRGQRGAARGRRRQTEAARAVPCIEALPPGALGLADVPQAPSPLPCAGGRGAGRARARGRVPPAAGAAPATDVRAASVARLGAARGGGGRGRAHVAPMPQQPAHRWWHSLSEDDPITLEPLSELAYPRARPRGCSLWHDALTCPCPLLNSV